MSVYTVSPDFLRSIVEDDGIYLTDILFVFTIRNNPFKVAKDSNKYVLDCYENIAKSNYSIKTWLDLMSFRPSPFETIDIVFPPGKEEEECFFLLCKGTKSQNKIIVYSIQRVAKHVCDNKIVQLENTAITVLDRDDARLELSELRSKGDTYINSQVAKHNSQIRDSTNLEG